MPIFIHIYIMFWHNRQYSFARLSFEELSIVTAVVAGVIETVSVVFMNVNES